MCTYNFALCHMTACLYGFTKVIKFIAYVHKEINFVKTVYMPIIHNLHYHYVGALVPNSRDQHEKQWRPDFTRHKTHPKIRFV